MRRDVLTFHLAPKNHASMSIEKTDAFSQDFLHSIGIKVHSGCWGDIELSSPKVQDFLEKAESLISKNKAVFYGFNMLKQTVVEDEQDLTEWYELVASSKFEGEKKKNLDVCKAYKMNSIYDVASGELQNQYVSERFKSVVENNNLSGIDFTWVIDTGKYKAKQWYRPIASQPLGRGVDHPWFDAGTLTGSDSFQPLSQKWRTGVWHFSNNQLKKDIDFNPIYKRLFALFESFDLTMIVCRQFLRQYLPITDFAFNWKFVDEKRINGGETILKHRGLCFNRKVKEILLKNQLITAEDIQPLIILDELPSGPTLLDGNDVLPDPYYSKDELATLSLEIEKKWKKFNSKEKIARVVSIKDATKLLRQSKANFPDNFCKGLPKTKISEENINLPGYWWEILKISNGGILRFECTILALEKLEKFNQQQINRAQSLYDEYPYELIYVGVSPEDDLFALEKNSVTSDDSKVYRISHEGLSVEYAWDNIPIFLHDILTGIYD